MAGNGTDIWTVIFCTFISGCTTLAQRIDECIHISENNTLKDDFDKGKYVTKRIIVKEYNQANRVNVFTIKYWWFC